MSVHELNSIYLLSSLQLIRRKNGSKFCQYAREEVSSLVKLEVTKNFETKSVEERKMVQNVTDMEQNMNENGAH